MYARTEERNTYQVAPCADEDRVIQQALDILRQRLIRSENLFSAPSEVRKYLTLSIASLEHEEFGVLWLDVQNRLIAEDRLFRGTLTQTSVYPREVVKGALKHNAGACILYHNHPSGNAEPSQADTMLTQTLRSALGLIDCRVLDHFVVPGDGSAPTSFAERGLI